MYTHLYSRHISCNTFPLFTVAAGAVTRRNPILSDLSAMKDLIVSQWVNLMLVSMLTSITHIWHI